MKLRASPVRIAAEERGLPVETPERSRNPEFVARLQELDTDALVVASYGQILSQAVLESATKGGINLHGSLLPLYRGAAPIQRAILDGQPETGVTLMQMDKGMDTGDVIAMRATPIGSDETSGELQGRLAQIAAEMASEWMPRVAAGGYQRTTQDNDRATMAPKVSKDEAALSFERAALEEYARFRAFTPNPGANLATSLGFWKVSKARFSEMTGEPGTVLSASLSCIIAFKGGSLELLEVQPEGKKRMTGSDLANGLRLISGTNLMPR